MNKEILRGMDFMFAPRKVPNEKKTHPATKTVAGFNHRERKIAAHTTIHGKGCVARLMNKKKGSNNAVVW